MESINIFWLIKILIFVKYILHLIFLFLFYFNKFLWRFLWFIFFYIFFFRIWVLFKSYLCQSFILKKLLSLIFKIWLSYIWILRWFRWSCSFLWFLFYIRIFTLLKKIILFNIIFILKLGLIMKILLLRISSSLLMNIFSRSRIWFIINYFFNWTSWICLLQNILN